MIAVIFEVSPTHDGRDEYLKIAAELNTILSKMDGFISVERFQSLANPNSLLSLSFWKDEASVKAWRDMEIHRKAQEKGRAYLFDNYRIRVADVLRDYGMDK